MPPAPPLITLLTDFGTRDWFVASLKGVILTINPAARIVDLSHDITPYGIAEAAYCLQACYRTFPAGTVHVVVVDPGVGGSRRPILAKAGDNYFVAPDNGVLTPIVGGGQPVEIRQLENPRYQLRSPGATFHGRDLFAPAAAWLTKGEALASFGRVVTDPVMLDWPRPVRDGSAIRGQIVYVDRFGNLISNISLADLPCDQLERMTMTIGGRPIGPLVSHYAAAASDVPQALINSQGLLEIFVRERPASELLSVGIGAVVEVAG